MSRRGRFRLRRLAQNMALRALTYALCNQDEECTWPETPEANAILGCTHGRNLRLHQQPEDEWELERQSYLATQIRFAREALRGE